MSLYKEIDLYMTVFYLSEAPYPPMTLYSPHPPYTVKKV